MSKSTDVKEVTPAERNCVKHMIPTAVEEVRELYKTDKNAFSIQMDKYYRNWRFVSEIEKSRFKSIMSQLMHEYIKEEKKEEEKEFLDTLEESFA